MKAVREAQEEIQAIQLGPLAGLNWLNSVICWVRDKLLDVYVLIDIGRKQIGLF